MGQRSSGRPANASLGSQREAFCVPSDIAYFNTANLAPQLNSVRTAGAGSEHAIEAAVFAATAADVHHVVIGGRIIVADGRHVSIDVAAELAAALP